VVCSTIAAFCWVDRSISLTTPLISRTLSACSLVATVIAPSRLATSPTRPAMPSSTVPVSPTSETPLPTWRVESAISRRISLAASDDRPDNARTSLATTAKPLPASTPALSARRLVWKAIPSITSMMLEISRAERSISSIAAIARRTTSPPSRDASHAAPTAPAASAASRAVSPIDPVTSVSAVAADSSRAACCSVRIARSSDAARISRAPPLTVSAVSPARRSAPDSASSAPL